MASSESVLANLNHGSNPAYRQIRNSLVSPAAQQPQVISFKAVDMAKQLVTSAGDSYKFWKSGYLHFPALIPGKFFPSPSREIQVSLKLSW